MSWRSRESSWGTRSRHARHPVPRARRRGSLALGGGARRTDQPQAIYRIPRTKPSAAKRAGPPADATEAAIVAVAQANQTDGYRMVCALVARKLGRAVNRKRVAESAPDLAALAVRVIEDDALATSLSRAGRRLVERAYDWAVVARPLLELHVRLSGR